LTLAVS